MNRFVLVLLAGALLGSASPQSRSAAKGPFRLVNVHVVGSTHFAEPDIVAATGLKLGAEVMPDDFKSIADKLISLGAFEQVDYQYGPAGNGIKVEFKVADAAHMLSVGFDNFVWFTDQQLIEAVRARVPMFQGEVPAEGEMLPQVIDALQAALIEKGIPGAVRFESQQEKLGEAISAGVFVVDGANINVRAVRFAGAPAGDVDDLERAAKPLLETRYQRAAAESFAQHNLRDVMLRKGYLRVTFGTPSAALVSAPKTPVVDIIVPLDAGPQYRLGALRWTGNKAIQTFDLSRLLKLTVGAPADQMQLQADLDAVHDAYTARGYLHQSTRAIPTFDDSVRVVSWELRVDEGDQYRLGSVDMEGLEPRVRDRVREVWKLRQGEPYNPNYVRDFLRDALPILPPGTITHQQVDIEENTRTVNVTLLFSSQARAK